MSNAIMLAAAQKFGDKEVRAYWRDGELWFPSVDICGSIEVDVTAVRKLDPDERDLISMETAGGNQQVSIISESGMYALVLRCRGAMKPGTVAHRFRKWVTSEVLPAIRKTGGYTVDASPEVPLLIGSKQQTELERAVHELATLAGQGGKNYRSVCLSTWRDLRKEFGLTEYVQLPAARFQEALDFVVDRRTQWEVVDTSASYTLENFTDMMNDFYFDNKVPVRVEVELARQLLMRTREAIGEAKFQLAWLKIADPEVRLCVRNANKILARKQLMVPLEPWHRSVALVRRVA